MSITIPLIITQIEGIKLPYRLYSDDKLNLLLSDFSISERESIFGISNLQVEGSSAKFGHKKSPSHFVDQFTEFITASYKIETVLKNVSYDEKILFDKIESDLSFCCQLFFEYPVTVKFFMPSGTSIHTILRFKHRALQPVVNAQVLDKFETTLQHCIKNDTIENSKKQMLLSLLTLTNIETFNIGLICSTYITILESLFINENTEITYRFALRLTKYMNEDSAYFKNIKKLYSKRSSYYHSDEKKFTRDDELFLSALTRQIIIEFVHNPKNFDVNELDEQLLR